MKLKQLFPSLLLLIFSSVAFAQSENPFASIGKKGKILTLTKGQYNETFDTDSIQQIGSSLINVRTLKVVKLLNDDESKKRLEGEKHSRFLSLDPLARSFPWNSPYSYAENDVIRAIDLDGAEKYIVINHFDHNRYLGTTVFKAEDVNKHLVNLTLYDSKSKTKYNAFNKVVMNYNTETKTITNIIGSEKDLSNWETTVLNKQGENVTANVIPNTKVFGLSITDNRYDFSGAPNATSVNPTLFTMHFHLMNASHFTVPLASINSKQMTTQMGESEVGKAVNSGDLKLKSVVLIFRTQADKDKYGDKLSQMTKGIYGDGTNVSTVVNKKYLDASDKKNKQKHSFGVALQTSTE
ncbi:MAG: hypothetical protein ACKVOM_13950 [Ferruginibacter sp.]